MELVLTLFFLLAQCTRFVVVDQAQGNDDPNSLGIAASPYKTLGFALAQTESESDVTITLREGRYEESNLIVKNRNNLLIRAANGQRVILDSTKEISSWTLSSDNQVYTADLTEPMWQIFIQSEESLVNADNVDHTFEMVGLARFPNAPTFSEKSWDRYQSMRHQDRSTSTNGRFVEVSDSCEDSSEKLDGQPSLDNCIAILNTGHWVTYARHISHVQGNDYFDYDATSTWYAKNSHYFIEGCLAALDAPGEWALQYHSDGTLRAHVWPENGEDLTNRIVRGTTASTILTVHNSNQITLRGLTFFGAGVRFVETSNSEVTDCVFDHASYSRRALGETSRALGALTFSHKALDQSVRTKNNVRRCTFKNTDGAAIEFWKQNANVIEDCFFKNIDYSALHAQGAVNFQTSFKTKFQFNHLDTTGSSETILAGSESLIKYNYFTNGGLLQEDGACVQIRSLNQAGSKIIRNWAIGNGKLGFRFDSPTESIKQGSHGLMKENVAFMNRRGLAVKGDYHNVFRNTALMNEWNNSPDIIVYIQNLNSAEFQYNGNSTTKRNFAGSLSGMTDDFDVPLRADAPLTSMNWNGRQEGEKIFNLLRDPAHGDFRPRHSSYNPYGAYRTNQAYWIPGPRMTYPSFPLPASQSTAVPVDVELKWKEARGQMNYDIYFGQTTADLSTPVEADYSGNIWTPPTLTSGQTYLWLVVETGSNPDLSSPWTFTTESTPFVYQDASVPCPEQTTVDVVAGLKTTIRQNDAWQVNSNNEGSWCQSNAVQNYYNANPLLQNYVAPTSGTSFSMFGDSCLTWQCAFEEMYKENCDLQKVARNDIGHNKLGRVTRELSQPFCFGSCPTFTQNPTVNVPNVSPAAFPYALYGCNEEKLLEEIEALNDRREQIKTWECAQYRDLYDASSMLQSSSCPNSLKLEMVRHVYNFFKFDDLVGELLSGCALTRRSLHSRLLHLE